MLALLRTQAPDSPATKYLDVAVTLRDGDHNVPTKPDNLFSIKTYQKISEVKEDSAGDQIMLPVNLFLGTLDFQEQNVLYDMYRFARVTIAAMTKENRRDLEKQLQKKIFDTIYHLGLVAKMISFCQSTQFIYPDLSTVGTEGHHTADKTFLVQDYVEITAISLLSKMMVPIWGEFISKLRALNVDGNKIEKFAFDLIEPVLDEGDFERIYKKLYNFLTNLVRERRRENDKKPTSSGVLSSYILTHNAIDDDMFNDIVMGTIVVKRMATYECFAISGGKTPNAMVYIDDGIKRTVDGRIQAMRSPMKTMPRNELPTHDTEDNSSILDHVSRTSKKSIDVPIFVVTAVETWELNKLLEETNTPLDVFEEASNFYVSNAFDVSPLCQAMVASFIGTRFGGSKCIGYLPPRLYQKIVVLLQIFLIRHELYDLLALVSSKTSLEPVEGAHGTLTSRIDSKLRSSEYLQCESLFKGWLEKPVVVFGKKQKGGKAETERLNFVNHIAKMKEWLVRYTHAENTAPALWAFANKTDYPVIGAEVAFDENVIRNLCRFYLMFHGTQRPF